MKITASQRQRAREKPERPVGPLHLELAKQRGLERRLLRGGALSLLASLLAWALGAALGYHLLVVLVAFALGALWRPRHTMRRAEGWALSWIETRVGLSYRTALELPNSDPLAGDPYGLGSAVRRRAEAATGQLEVPPAQPWWLPLSVLAAVFALLPALSIPGLQAPLGDLFGGGPPGVNAPPSALDGQDESTSEAESTPEGADTPTEDASGRAEERPDEGVGELPPEGTALETDTPTADSGTEEGAATGLGETGEQGALERYLSGLEEALPETAPQQEGASEGSDGGGAAEDLPPGLATPNAPQPGAAEASSNAEGQQGETSPQEATESAANTAANSEESGAQGDQDTAPQRPDDAQERAATGDTPTDPSLADDAPAEASSDPAGEQTQSDEADDSESRDAPAPNEEPSEGVGEESAAGESESEGESPSEGGEQEGAPAFGEDEAQIAPDATGGLGSEVDGATSLEDDEGEGGAAQAGVRSDERDAGTGERLDGVSEAPLQRLPGVRDEQGPSQSGEVLQRGSDDVLLPEGQTPESYARAAEEVISEGRLPLEYQDIVREYFR